MDPQNLNSSRRIQDPDKKKKPLYYENEVRVYKWLLDQRENHYSVTIPGIQLAIMYDVLKNPLLLAPTNENALSDANVTFLFEFD